MKKLVFILLTALVFAYSLQGREFVHIITSKGIYETSEDLWFKCIVVDDSTLQISDRSHTAYVEMVDPADSVVWREKYRVSNGMCDGHIFVGTNWKPGEYRLFAHTRGSLGRGDTIIYPKRLLVVRELPEVPQYLDHAKESVTYVDLPDSMPEPEMQISVTLDSTEYHTKSKIKATVKVRDREGNPVKTVVAISLADALYSYPPAQVNIQSRIYGMECDSLNNAGNFIPFLADGAAAGYLRSGRKKNPLPTDGKAINIFDEKAGRGNINIISTGREGYFEVSPEIGSALDRRILLKPLADEELKPRLEINNHFGEIEKIHKNAAERYYPAIRRKTETGTADTADYSGRHTVTLDELVVTGNNHRYPKRSKVMQYLDSLAIGAGTEWVCCGEIIDGKYHGGFLNDYIAGYNHHPPDEPNGSNYQLAPKNISLPEKGKLYRMIKMRWDERMGSYTYEHEMFMIYPGPKTSDEGLLEKNGIWQAVGYYPKRRFNLPSEYDFAMGTADNRNTLLWLPRAQTDEKGEFTIEIPTSDIRSLFKLTCTVITPDARNITQSEQYLRIK